jgi:putative transposase
MARLARAVVPSAPHHVLQEGRPGQRFFESDADYREYLALLAEGCAGARVAILAYCLLPKRVHLILLPRGKDGLRAALGEAHRRFTRLMNQRRERGGNLFRGRFASFPMDREAFVLCARYVEQAPLRAKLVTRARDWRWSSAGAHVKGRKDPVVDVKPLLDRVDDWRALLEEALSKDEMRRIGASEHTGRPFGSPTFVARVEARLGRTLARQKPGPKPKKKSKLKKRK